MNEFEKRTRRACFTGHRPEKLTRSETVIRKDLEIQICRAVADGLNIFITGMGSLRHAGRILGVVEPSYFL